MLGIGAFPGSSEPRLINHSSPPDPAAGQVLCQTIELGVCGTDRDILESNSPLVPGGETHLVLGHECLARVLAIGPDVSGFSAGDWVVPVVRRAFDRSNPRPDMLPFGTFTERGIVHEHGFSFSHWLDKPQYLFRVAPEIVSVAVLTEPLSVAEKGIHEALAVQRGRLGPTAWTQPPPRVLVTGQGPIAFACVLACRALSWPTTVIGRDRQDTFRAELAQRLAADYLSADQLQTEPADVEQDGFDLILECTGNDEVLLKAAQSLASCGVMVWLGSSRMPQARLHNLDVLMRNAVLRNHVHLGTVNAAPRDFVAALDHLAQLQQTCGTELSAVLTERVSIEDSLWHYRHRVPQGIKTVVAYD